MSIQVMTLRVFPEEVETNQLRSAPPGERLLDEVYAKILTDSRVVPGQYAGQTDALGLPIQGVVVTARPS